MKEPQIIELNEKKLIGMSIEMSLADNKTFQLFKTFMPLRKEVANAKSAKVFDVKIYPEDYYQNFNPSRTFTKLAMVEVTDFTQLPDQMETLTIPNGLYAVFIHKGANADISVFQYIFSTWLPNSDYQLDNRPHFDVLNDKQNDPNAEEEIWIPIKKK